MAKVNKTSKRHVTAVERQEQAFEYRKAGASYPKIGKQLGVSTVAAYKMIQNKLVEIGKQTAENAEQILKIELERLDHLFLVMWKQALGGSQSAVDRLLKIMDRRAKYLGLDAPIRLKVNVADILKQEANAAGIDWAGNPALAAIIAAAEATGGGSGNHSAVGQA